MSKKSSDDSANIRPNELDADLRATTVSEEEIEAAMHEVEDLPRVGEMYSDKVDPAIVAALKTRLPEAGIEGDSASDEQTAIDSLHLEVVAGPHRGESRHVAAGMTLAVGRSSAASWRLAKELRLSRTHFRIDVGVTRCMLEDLGSTNGTLVNGKRVKEAEIKNGDRIQCGKTVIAIRVLFGDSDADANTGKTVHF